MLIPTARAADQTPTDITPDKLSRTIYLMLISLLMRKISAKIFFIMAEYGKT